MGFFSDKVKNIDAFDVALIKLSVAAFTLFVITIWQGAMDWVHSVNTWYFLVAFVIFAIRPVYRSYFK
ncbi:hypothetical protein HOE04_03245 [archaeon]|jgi:hypothetical protein|nr:hypothetical protein [archaeon]